MNTYTKPKNQTKQHLKPQNHHTTNPIKHTKTNPIVGGGSSAFVLGGVLGLCFLLLLIGPFLQPPAKWVLEFLPPSLGGKAWSRRSQNTLHVFPCLKFNSFFSGATPFELKGNIPTLLAPGFRGTTPTQVTPYGFVNFEKHQKTHPTTPKPHHKKKHTTTGEVRPAPNPKPKNPPHPQTPP